MTLFPPHCIHRTPKRACCVRVTCDCNGKDAEQRQLCSSVACQPDHLGRAEGAKEREAKARAKRGEVLRERRALASGVGHGSQPTTTFHHTSKPQLWCDHTIRAQADAPAAACQEMSGSGLEGQHPVLFLSWRISDSSLVARAVSFHQFRGEARAKRKPRYRQGLLGLAKGKAKLGKEARPDTCEGSGNRAFRYLARGS